MTDKTTTQQLKDIDYHISATHAEVTSISERLAGVEITLNEILDALYGDQENDEL